MRRYREKLKGNKDTHDTLKEKDRIRKANKRIEMSQLNLMSHRRANKKAVQKHHLIKKEETSI